MKKRAKVSITVLVCIAIIGIIWSLLIGNPVIFRNNKKLGNSVKSINTEMVQLNDVVPFEWDTLYTFEPYQSKKEIEKIVGFKSVYIKANNISEGMVHLLFTKDGKVVASVLGYDSNLGYSIDFTSKEGLKVSFAENAHFKVTKRDGITTLTYVK